MKELPIIYRALQLGNVLVPIKSGYTAKYVLEEIQQYDPLILDKTIPELINPAQPTGVFHECKTTAMWVMMILMSTAYAINNIYISFTTGTILEWDMMVLTLIGPIVIVLYDRGVISRENREVLSLLAGNTPTLTLMESISQRIASGPQRERVYKRKEKTIISEQQPVNVIDNDLEKDY